MRLSGSNLFSMLALAMFFGITCSAQAQDKYPSRPIHLIVPFAAGGAADLVARLIGQSVSERLGQPVVVENKPGATGAIGGLMVARAQPDGYTLLTAVISSNAVLPAMKKNPPFDPVKDFTPIVRIANSIHALVARNSLPVSDVKELIAYAKAHPVKVTYGSSGIASFPYLGAKLMEREAGIEMVHVPYPGDAPAMMSVASGNVDILFTPSARTYVESKTVKLIGVATLQRTPTYPNWPTLNETGLRGFALVGWVGFMGPKGMPQTIVEKINAAVNDSLKTPAVQQKLDQIGYAVAGGSAAEYAKDIRDEVERIRSLNISIE